MPDSQYPQTDSLMLPVSVLVAGVLIATSIWFSGERVANATERRITDCLAFYEEELLRRFDFPTEEQLDSARRNAAAACHQRG